MIATVIGIDYATDAKNIGLARASFHGNSVKILEAVCGETQSDLLKLVTRWVETEDRALLALDAPLARLCRASWRDSSWIPTERRVRQSNGLGSA